MKRVPIKLAVQDAMDAMDITETDDMPKFMVWAVDAEKRISGRIGLKRYIKVFTVEDCYIEMPCHVTDVKCIVVGDHGCECGDLFDRIGNSEPLYKISVDSGLMVVDATTIAPCTRELKWEFINNRVEFNQNLHNKKVTAVVYGLIMDDKGIPLVNDTHLRAISQYVQFRNLKRSRWKGNRIQIDLDAEETEYHRLVRDARANDDKQSPAVEDLNSHIMNNPISGYGYYTPYNRFIY